MNILLVNDDGYNSTGINLLKKKLEKYGKIYVMAPATPQSGASHSFNVRGPFEVTKYSDFDYSAGSSPADCVRLATSILNVKFDLVFSGINNGLNVGTDVFYSGTVAAAREALIEGIPAVAISTDTNCFKICDLELDDILKMIFDKKLYSNKYLLNINFPISKFEKSLGVKAAIHGKKLFKTEFIEKDNLYYVGSESISYDTLENSDVYLGIKGYTTIVPIDLDSTDYNALNKINDIIK